MKPCQKQVSEAWLPASLASPEADYDYEPANDLGATLDHVVRDLSRAGTFLPQSKVYQTISVGVDSDVEVQDFTVFYGLD